jgi:IS5 family transposase
LTDGFVPKKSALQSAISKIADQTWERINLALLNHAKASGIEKGTMLRIDSTVTETHIHGPTDSSLLWDSVRVMTRLLKQAEALGVGFEWHDHHRVAKKRARAIIYTKGQDKKKGLYGDLLRYTEKALQYIDNAKIAGHVKQPVGWKFWCLEVGNLLPLVRQVIAQTTRRVFNDEKVPATEKIFSLFETHTDIIVKGNREKQYGHKLNLSTGRSGMVLDVVIESGNPADSDQFIPMLDRHIKKFGKAPKQAAADGGYASKENLEAAKQRDVKDVAFHKKRGLEILDMVKSTWVYRKLRNFRAGIEAGISYLKRCFGLSRCNWKGLGHFKAYVWSSVVAHNLVMMARLQT